MQSEIILTESELSCFSEIFFSTTEELSKFLPAKTVVFSGHTHIPIIIEENELIFVNPGSISIPKSEEGRCYGILSVEKDKKSVEIKGLFDLEQKKCLLF